MSTVAWLADLGRLQTDAVGAKAANLGELTRAGLPVPRGFVVGADAYLDAMEEGGVAEELRALHTVALGQIDEPVALARTAERLRALVRKAGLPPELGDEVIEAYHELGPDLPVAVRSSALGEDGETASFAGMYDSYTNVIGDSGVLARVVECWVSLFGERVIAYRAARATRDEPAIAVMVQQLVPADYAGVMFTADPATGQRDRIIIEASYGLGEVVMAGELEPDRYVVTNEGPRLLEVDIGNKTHKAVATSDGDVRRVDVPPADVCRQAVSDTGIIALAQSALAAEGALGGNPQDIEWAIVDGSTYVLQARPITTLGSVSEGYGPEVMGEVLVRGLAAAPGVATGRVRILMSPEHWRLVEPGEVLVAAMTNPEWAPAVRRAGAVVTDGGGLTCHGAIVARELGVPCVVGTRVATTRLSDGQCVTVDGHRGLVLDRHAEGE